MLCEGDELSQEVCEGVTLVVVRAKVYAGKNNFFNTLVYEVRAFVDYFRERAAGGGTTGNVNNTVGAGMIAAVLDFYSYAGGILGG